ncbi:MAG: SDR family oxidoreductase [Candidatus Hydrogenedentes bacterium]|nr:SDR family oxidoreductase [Candidatus Hydrogenedentota bacterium]
MAFKGKSAIVSGGAQGIGKAVSIAFARAHAAVYVADTDAEAGAELVDALSAEGLAAVFVATDVSREDDVAALVQRVVSDAGGIGVLVNNAGIGGDTTLWDRPMAEWDRVLAVNLRGPYMCAKYASPHMPPGSAIVNIASTRALMSEANTEPYSASKGGVLALTHALAVTLAGPRIRVNAISPGWIDVSGWQKASTRKQAALSQRDHEQHPAGRVGAPEDIAEACLFLADTARSGFITGTNLVVDGGMTVKMIYE